MASISTGASAGGGRRRSLDAEINLVPFIDLLSMCICFLLMTAVWVQIGAVQVKQSRGTEAAPTAANQLELSIKFAGPWAVDLEFKRGARVVKKRSVKGVDAADLAKQLDTGLASWDETRNPKMISSGMVTPRTGVTYGDLVGVMDVLRSHQIINLGVVPISGGGNKP